MGLSVDAALTRFLVEGLLLGMAICTGVIGVVKYNRSALNKVH
jgi:hypothetical protein